MGDLRADRNAALIRVLRLAAIASVAVWLVASAGPARAATFSVTTETDAVDAAPGDGVCATADGGCSLRAAVQEANALGGPHTITIPAGTYVLRLQPPPPDHVHDDEAVHGDLDIRGPLTVTGAGQSITRIQGLRRAFHVLAGAAARVSSLTVETSREPYPTLPGTHGCAPGAQSAGSGAAFLNEGTLDLTDVDLGLNMLGVYGAVCSLGTITLTRVGLSGNSGPGLVAHGTTVIQDSSISGNSTFGIEAKGTLTITGSTIAGHNDRGVKADGVVTISRSTISGNQGTGLLGSGALTVTDSTISSNVGYETGGIAFSGCGTLTNTTISGNRGSGAESLAGGAGGLRILPGGCASPWRLTNVTIADNVLTGLGRNINFFAGVAINGGPVEVKNTLLANNYTNYPEDPNRRAINCAEALISLGGNLVFPATSAAPATDCGFTAAQGDLVNVDPHLGPLASNGGPTLTQAFRPEYGADALDRGMNDGCPPLDQRGQSRPRNVTYQDGPRCDVGAVEHQVQVMDGMLPSTTLTLGGVAAPAWNWGPVTATLVATDLGVSGVRGVREIVYSLSGAQTGGGTVPTSTVVVEVTADGATTLRYFARDREGNAEAPKEVVIQIDRDAPVVTFAGNAGTYTVDQTVRIQCSYAEAVSGVVASTCRQFSRPAYVLPLGSNTLTATVADRAGHKTTTSTTFVVRVTYASLCAVTRSLSSSADVADSMCGTLARAAASAARGDLAAKEHFLAAYAQQANGQVGAALTGDEAAVLVRLADAL